MAQLLLLGDSQVERVWNHVRGDRDLLRTGLFFPVKSRKAMDAGSILFLVPNVNFPG